MKSYTITVNGNVYDVTVEEVANGTAPAARPAAAPVAAPKAAPAKAAYQMRSESEVTVRTHALSPDTGNRMQLQSSKSFPMSD